MTIQELINELELIEDKSKLVKVADIDGHLDDAIIEDDYVGFIFLEAKGDV